jgi:hemerythrin-like domain-containing protein
MRSPGPADDASEQLDAAREFLSFFDEHTVLHFREEEEVVFPLVIDHPDAPTELLARLLVDHVRLHRMVDVLRDQLSRCNPDPALLAQVGETLSGHIRAEENELFPAIEQLVGDSQLNQISLAERHREPPPRP